MKLKCLILACLIASGSANATVVTTSAVAGAVASANANAYVHHREHERNNANRSVNNALENGYRVLIQCKPKYIGGGIFDNTRSRVDREVTIEDCEDDKEKFERLNGVKYRFGKAVSYDRYNNYFYFELIEE